MSSRGVTARLYHMEDLSFITVGEEDQAGYFREAPESWTADSMEGRRICRQDSVFAVPCAKHVRGFRVRVRYVAASYLRRLF